MQIWWSDLSGGVGGGDSITFFFFCLTFVWLAQVFVESLLCSSRVENIRLAGQLMHCSKVQHGGAPSRRFWCTSLSKRSSWILDFIFGNARRSARTSPSVCPSGAKVTPSRSPTRAAWTWCWPRPASTSTRRPPWRIPAWTWPGEPLGGAAAALSVRPVCVILHHYSSPWGASLCVVVCCCVCFIFYLTPPFISIGCEFKKQNFSETWPCLICF